MKRIAKPGAQTGMQHQVVAEGCVCKHHVLRHVVSAKCHLPRWSLVPQPPLCSGTPYAWASTTSEGIINQGDQLCLPGKVRQQEKSVCVHVREGGMMQTQAWLQGRTLRQESALREAVREACKAAASSREKTGKKDGGSVSIKWLRRWDQWENLNYSGTGNTV